MSGIGSISPSTSGDISPYFLTVNRSAVNVPKDGSGAFDIAQASPDTAFMQSAGSDEVVVIGNPGGQSDLDWLINGFLPAVNYPILSGYDWPTGSYAAYQAYIGAITSLSQRRQELTDFFNAQPDDKPIVLYLRDDENREVVLSTVMGEVKAKFFSFTYNVVQGMRLNPGYGGFTGPTQDGSGYYSNIDFNVFMRYWTSWGEAGMVYYMLHELSHNIDSVKQYELTEAPRFLQNNNTNQYDYRYGSSPEFNRIEAMANTMTKHLASTLGIATVSEPPHGTF